MLPVAAIANLDGSEPEWDGAPGIRPLSDVLTIGDPTDDYPLLTTSTPKNPTAHNSPATAT
jgi:hypothetical protein